MPPLALPASLFGVVVGCVASLPVAGAAPDLTRIPVRYELTGSGVAEYVTFQTNDGQQHATNVKLPWAMELTGWVSNSTHSNVYLISAQGAGPGSITCKVLLDGKVVAQNTATGDPARVYCEHH